MLVLRGLTELPITPTYEYGMTHDLIRGTLKHVILLPKERNISPEDPEATS